MLHWRLALGFSIVAVLAGLCWLDAHAWVSGIVLLPLAYICMAMTTSEVLDLLEAGGIHPRRWVVHLGNTIVIAFSWGACVACDHLYRDAVEGTPAVHGWQWSSTACVWTLLGFAGSVILMFVAEMRRFSKPGGVTINLAGDVFAMTYIGLMMSFLVQIRMAWGLRALLSLILVVKLADIGAYTIGRIFGRNKMAPDLSPGKTIEGAIGGLVFACIGSGIWFTIISDSTSWTGWLTYGLAVAMAGMAGDLAESLIKRDVKQKDSSRWMPGFGGVLDIMDSILIAAPVAYAWWILGLVGSDIY